MTVLSWRFRIDGSDCVVAELNKAELKGSLSTKYELVLF